MPGRFRSVGNQPEPKLIESSTSRSARRPRATPRGSGARHRAPAAARLERVEPVGVDPHVPRARPRSRAPWRAPRRSVTPGQLPTLRPVPAALRCESLEKRYGAAVALGGVDLEVGAGRARRPARPERRGQVDAREDRLRPRARRPPGGREVGGAPAGSPEARARDRLPRRAVPLPRLAARADELLALHQRLAGSEGGAAERARAARARRPRRGGRHAASARCRRACSSGSGSRRRWSARRGCCCSTSPRARSTPSGRRIVRDLLERAARARRRGAAELAPAQRGRARLRPRGDPRRRRGRRRAARRPSWRGRAASRSRPASGVARVPRRRPRGRAADRGASWSPRASRSTACACCASTLEDAYLEAVGGGVSSAVIVAATRCARRAPARVPRSSLFLTVAFLGALRRSALRASRSTRSTRARRRRPASTTEVARRARRCSGSRCSRTLFLGAVLAVFLTLGAVRGDAERGLLQPLRRAAARARRSCCSAASRGAASVCALYVALRLRRARC